MEKFSNIQLEPYQEKGIMGGDVKINRNAAFDFMRSANMRRFIVITKQAGARNSVEELGETLAFKKYTVPVLDHWQSSLHEVTKEQYYYEISIDDQTLWQNADDKLSKKYIKRTDEISSHQLLRREFVKNLNQEVASGLKQIVWDEKLGFQEQGVCYFRMIQTFLALNIVVAVFDVLNSGHLMTVSSTPFLLRNLGIYGLHMFFQNIASLNSRRVESQNPFPLHPSIREDLHLFPVPIDRWAQGYYQILRNQGKFIVERSKTALASN